MTLWNIVILGLASMKKTRLTRKLIDGTMHEQFDIQHSSVNESSIITHREEPTLDVRWMLPKLLSIFIVKQDWMCHTIEV